MLEERLERFEENESDVNAFLVEALAELGAKETAPLIERAFAEGYVDPIVMGDWEDVQVELGLKSAEEVAPKQRSERREGLVPSPQASKTFTPASSQVAHKQKAVPSPQASKTFTPASSQVAHKQKAMQKKAKSKLAKLSRKKNRLAAIVSTNAIISNVLRIYPLLVTNI